MKKLMKHFLERHHIKILIKDDIKKGVNEAKSKSITLIITTAAITYLISCLVLNIIHHFDVGIYYGSKLKKYLVQEISEELDIKNLNNIELINIDKHFINNLEKDEIITAVGTYRRDSINEENDQVSVNYARFITIFEREGKGFVNFLFRTEPKYKIIGAYKFDVLNERDLYFIGQNYYDFNEDGTKELYIDFQTNHGSDISTSTFILKRNKKTWDVITPELDNLENDSGVIENNYYISVFEYPIINILNGEESMGYSISKPGGLDFVKNALFNHWNFAYTIPLSKKDNSKAYAIVMLRLDGTKLIRDNSWNSGKVIIDDGTSEFDIMDYLGSLQTDDIIFYSEP